MNTLNHYEIIADFRDFAQNSAGIELPDNLIADGKLHRFKINGEKSGKLSGAYTLHLDGKPAGYIQDFRTENKLNWTFKGEYQGEPISQAEIKRKQQQADKEQATSYAQAAKKAKSIWNATKEITKQDDHLYLLKKRIQPHHARLKELPSSLDNGYENGFSANQLVIPVQDSTGKLTTLQFINPDGSKKFLQDGKKRGCYSVLNRMDKPRIIAIAEGFATIASISEDAYIQNNGYLCVMGLDADNLPLVARAMREQYPTTDIIVFGDIGDTGNKGEIKAREAAKAVNGYCVLPPMTKGDFNDYLTSDNVTVSLEDLIFNAVNHDSLDTISNTATQHQQHHHQRQNL